MADKCSQCHRFFEDHTIIQLKDCAAMPDSLRHNEDAIAQSIRSAAILIELMRRLS